MQLASEILTKTGVAVTPGLDFDLSRGKSWMRFRLPGDMSVLAEAFERLDGWIKTR